MSTIRVEVDMRLRCHLVEIKMGWSNAYARGFVRAR
ncbi:hypothetical protein LMG31841_02329 [Paraburkholderia saeva]|uniref:Uncharacterized protein n=1 Tax=Paraburkholderia saeva TaxID=2777537 RepID=A0A9N8RW30_9BURK|nr:hypothetical protein LMG31841_02329 [Paraburkholderia saeva]